MGIAHHVNDPECHTDQFKLRSVTAIAREVLSSLPTNVSYAIITLKNMTNPATLIQKLCSHITNKSESDLHALENKADKTHATKCGNLKE